MKSQLFVVDASGYLYRSYHAISFMTNPEGESTNALFGFVRSILKLIKDFSPNALVAVFDGPNNIKKRKAIYPDYKAHRTEMPADLRYQIDWAKDFCTYYGIPLLNIPDVEADDTMGSVAKWATGRFEEIFLCTSDKDMAQLVGNGVKLLNTHKENTILDADGIKQKYGVPPEKIIDFFSIIGDSSDNIPGLPGFGPKTAVELLLQFDSLEYILEHPQEIKGKKKQETIRDEAEKAHISKKLITIDCDVPIPNEPLFFSLQKPQAAELQLFYRRMNFYSLLKELNIADQQSTDQQMAERKEVKEENFCYLLIDEEETLEALLAKLSSQKELCFSTETTVIHPIKAELIGVSFAITPGQAWYIPANGNLGKERLLTSLKPLLENPQISFYGHNIKYDYQVMRNCGITVARISFDTAIASFLLNSNSRQHSLDFLTLHLFNKAKINAESLTGKRKQQIAMHEVPVQNIFTYCCEGVDYTCRLKQLFEKQLKERALFPIFKKLELPLLPVLAEMERHGVYLDLPVLQLLGKKVTAELDSLAKEIFCLAGEIFNINSPKQLSRILFEKMGILPPRKTATGHSTDADVLETLKSNFPIAQRILEYRTLEKLRSTYIESLPNDINPTTGRIHPTFNQFVAATGRLSCQDPNLQNIPTRSEMGKNIREAFRPEKTGWCFLAADYSQIELRLLAHFSEDPHLIQAFQKGEDIHSHTAASIFGVPLDSVTYDMRYRAKAVNFGVIYGQQAFGLARELNIDFKEAKAFIERYFDTFPRVKEYLEDCKERARKEGKAVTYTGRERAIPEINSKNAQIRAAAERLAVNTPLQGGAADLIKQAMISIDQQLKKERLLGYMILQIHDELIFELPDFELLSLEPIVKSTMENVLTLKIPLTVNISIGKNWKEC